MTKEDEEDQGEEEEEKRDSLEKERGIRAEEKWRGGSLRLAKVME